MSVSPLYLYSLFMLIWSDCATQLGIFHIPVLKGNPYLDCFPINLQLKSQQEGWI